MRTTEQLASTFGFPLRVFISRPHVFIAFTTIKSSLLGASWIRKDWSCLTLSQPSASGPGSSHHSALLLVGSLRSSRIMDGCDYKMGDAAASYLLVFSIFIPLSKHMLSRFAEDRWS